MDITLFHQGDLSSLHFSRPAQNEIHIFLLPLDTFYILEQDIHLLPPHELEQAQRFSKREDQLLYLVGHAALRRALSHYLNVPADSLHFSKGIHGKPFLDSEKTLHFNLSHSGNQVALAFCSETPVGIDIEEKKPSDRLLKLASRYYHPDELPFLSSLKKIELAALFYRYWTIREAFLKGLGTGLTLSPNSFLVQPDYSLENAPVDFSGRYHIEKSQEDYSDWQIQSVPCPEGYMCSIAYQRL